MPGVMIREIQQGDDVVSGQRTLHEEEMLNLRLRTGGIS